MSFEDEIERVAKEMHDELVGPYVKRIAELESEITRLRSELALERREEL